ncbi:MAG TPA: GNAT family N-acetyltransferase [Herpetosiphonaceae bacterium]
MLFADLALAQRLERNEALNNAEYAHTLKRLQPDSSAQVVPVAGGYATFTRPDFPVNRAIGLGMSQPVTDADLDTLEALYRGYGLPAQVDVCPLADGSLVAALGRRGYRIVRFFNRHIRAIGAADMQEAPYPAIRVAAVAADDIDLWERTVDRGFSGRDDLAADAMGLSLARLAFQRPTVTCFLARIGDEPVGAAGLAIRDGLATFFSTSTRVEYRRRGVHTALLRARLAAAASAGCGLATVAPLPGSDSQRNVQRAGFQIAYTRLVMQRELA